MARYLAAAVLMTAVMAAGGAEPQHGMRPDALVIRGGIMIDGVGTPAEGPVDIVVRGNRIESIGRLPAELPDDLAAAPVIDATGKYLLPGFINMHGHIHDTWMGQTAPLDYIYNLWLACGITTIRDVGSRTSITLREREKSARGEIAAPRIFLYFWFPNGELGAEEKPVDQMTESELRQAVLDIEQRGADGMKLRHFDRDTVAVIMETANERGLPVAHHVGIEDMNAWDNAAFGTTTIEHWYGVPDAALDHIQQFPPEFNHANELHRFRYAGRLWRETNPERLDVLLDALVNAGVAWNPTFAIYEACRDLQRAVTQPWLRDFLHPGLARFFEPNPESHGSFFFGWTHTDEVYWKENFRIWMDAVKTFAEKGGIVTTGEDAGYIYQVYGFCYLRELQLHEEAGFHPIEVIKHATHNGARVLGQEQTLGRLKPGYAADILVVDGNPLDNLQILLPRGIDETLDHQHQGRGGIDWTIKDGIPYRPAILLENARAIVAEALSNPQF